MKARVGPWQVAAAVTAFECCRFTLSHIRKGASRHMGTTCQLTTMPTALIQLPSSTCLVNLTVQQAAPKARKSCGPEVSVLLHSFLLLAYLLHFILPILSLRLLHFLFSRLNDQFPSLLKFSPAQNPCCLRFV